MSETSVGTGRLFRSLRAEGAAADTAVPALSLDEAVGLRTVTLGNAPSSNSQPPRAPDAVAVAVAAVTPPDVIASGAVASDIVIEPHMEYAEVAPRLDEDDDVASRGGVLPEAAVRAEGSGRRGAHAAPGVRAAGVWLVVLGVTIVMAFADALVVGRTELGWLTGVSMLAATVYGALVVRREDAIVAVIAPPLAFFLATITAGQLTLPPTGDLLVREAFMIITTLGSNAIWIFGSTLVALVIVLVRRRRSRPNPAEAAPQA